MAKKKLIKNYYHFIKKIKRFSNDIIIINKEIFYFIKLIIKHRFIKFGFIGLIGTITDLIVLYVLKSILKINLYIAVLISYFCGLIVNFFLNKRFTFKTKSNNPRLQFSIFFVIAMVGLLINEIIIYILVRFFNIYYIFAKIIGIGIAFIFRYFGHVNLSFNEKFHNKLKKRFKR